jgi:hypothetical protein
LRLSVLIRGNNYIEKDRFGLPMDARKNIDSIIENIVAPVRESNPDAKIYLATYDSPALAELQDKLGPCELIKLDAQGSSQIETYKEGLKHVFAQDEYDALAVIRFDLQFRKKITDWNVDISRDSIYFPVKEYKSYWRDHWRVGDAVHVIGKSAISHFYNAMIMNQLSGRAHLHLMYYFLRTMHANLRFIEDGYFDSNTLFANPECDNPLYKIFNRPRLTTPSPSMGMQLGEIQAE